MAMRLGGLRGLVGAIALLVPAGCNKDEGQPKSKAGHPSPPLDELVEAAVAQGPPRTPDTSYTPPARIAVPEVKPPDLGVLRKDEEGMPIIAEEHGVRLRVNLNKRDAITAMSACSNRVAACVQRKDLPGGRSIDACWMHAPRCQSDHPWDEVGGCCPTRCSELYEALRKRNYSEREASLRTMRSECFNGLRELLAEDK